MYSSHDEHEGRNTQGYTDVWADFLDFRFWLHSKDAVTKLAGMIMQNFIASEVGVYLDRHLSLGGVYEK